VLKKGYRERSHHCLLIAVRELYVKDGSIDARLAEEFDLCMGIRLDADYGIIYDQESAEIAIRRRHEITVSQRGCRFARPTRRTTET